MRFDFDKLKRLILERGRAEWLPLVTLLIGAASLWIFIEIADEVNEGELANLDRSILTFFRQADNTDQPIGPHWLEEAVRDVTALGSFVVIVFATLAAAGYLWLKRKMLAAVYLLFAVAGAQLISVLLKSAFDRTRPDLFTHGMTVYSASFPSGHSMMSVATFLTLGVMLARYESLLRLRIFVISLAILISIAVGMSRIYLAVHWPTDVLGGWALGSSWALLCWSLANFLQRRRVMERPE